MRSASRIARTAGVVASLVLLGSLVCASPTPVTAATTVANGPITTRFFAAGSPWTADVSALPVDARSGAYLRSMGLDTEVHPDFGTTWNGAPNGIPYVLVRGTQPRVPVTFYYAGESDPGPYPIPRDAPVEGGPNGTGDRHILVFDTDNRKLYEVYDAHYNTRYARWDCGSGAVWDLDAMPVRPDGWTSADAAGLAMLPGLVRYDEVARGEIAHALRFTVPETQRTYRWPALHFASDATDANLPPMGLRVRLKKDFDISRFPKPVQVILRALKKYGMIVADNGGPWYISGAPDPRWNDELLHAITAVKGSDFEVVDTTRIRPAAPVIYAGRGFTLRAGRSCGRDGWFADPAGSRWTASVDWGDGTKQALALTADKRFRLAHRYTKVGLHYMVVSVRNERGAVGKFTVRVGISQ
jgi:hypothetical protein